MDFKETEVWFVTGSQHLYGEPRSSRLPSIRRRSRAGFRRSGKLPVKVVFKPVVTTPEAIYGVCQEANYAPELRRTYHLDAHVFAGQDVDRRAEGAAETLCPPAHAVQPQSCPWSTIDMDFMNLNQSAHGDREFGFIGSRMRLNRKVIVGYWQDEDVLAKLATWMRAACAWHDMQDAKVARFGDNMRDVAVTEGDKVAAQIQFGYSVYGYGVGDLVDAVNAVPDAAVDKLVAEYDDQYDVSQNLCAEAGSSMRPCGRPHASSWE